MKQPYIFGCLCALGFSGVMLTTAAQGPAQTCTTQAKLGSSTREALSDVSLRLTSAIKAGDSATVQGLSLSEIASNFGPTGYLIRTTSEALAPDTLRVSQLYTLDANAQTDPSAEADFACALTGSSSEVDFAIAPLPAGLYAFAMVEASGDRPWLLSFLLKQQAGVWKMAGFYPRPRSAAGHDGLAYWRDARIKAAAGQNWLAWLEFGEADALLRPANFVVTTHLDKLRSEQKTAAPPALRDGLDTNTPLVVKDASGADFAITALQAVGSDDGKSLNLSLHFRAEPLADPAAGRARNLAAARALTVAHPELVGPFNKVLISADIAGQAPFITEATPAELR